MNIFCPICLKEGTRQLIPVQEGDEAAICPACQRRYGVLSRRIERVLSEKIGENTYRYRFYTKEPGGGDRIRTAVTAPNQSLRSGNLLTFVWRGRDLVGVADQGSQTWQSVLVEKPLYPTLQSFLRALRWPVLLLLLLQAARFFIELPGVLTNYPLQMIFALIMLGTLLLAPAALWAMREGGAKTQHLPDLNQFDDPE